MLLAPWGNSAFRSAGNPGSHVPGKNTGGSGSKLLTLWRKGTITSDQEVRLEVYEDDEDDEDAVASSGKVRSRTFAFPPPRRFGTDGAVLRNDQTYADWQNWRSL